MNVQSILASLAGEALTRQIIIQTVTLWEYVLSGVLFSIPFRRKRQLLPWAILSTVWFVAMDAAMAALRVSFDSFAVRILCAFLKSTVMLPIFFLCCVEDWSVLAMGWCASIATVEGCARVWSLMLTVAGVDDTASNSLIGDPGSHVLLNWLIFFAFRALVYGGCYWFFGRGERTKIDRGSKIGITALAVFTAIGMNFLGNLTGLYRGDGVVLYVINQIYGLAACSFILTLQAGILSINRYRQETVLMEQLLREDRKQYVALKQNMDIINMKCHDLKHLLSNYAGKLTDREIAELQEAISIYDSNIKTGSEVLDVLLYKLRLSTEQEGIQISCMAQGSCLAFMRTRHVYSLFDNALGNAVEAVRQLEDPEKRLVSLTVAQAGHQVEATITNYFTGTLHLSEGETSKEDADHHGFGMMSMRYIVEQYGGTLEPSVFGDIFTLRIVIPVPETF